MGSCRETIQEGMVTRPTRQARTIVRRWQLVVPRTARLGAMALLMLLPVDLPRCPAATLVEDKLLAGHAQDSFGGRGGGTTTPEEPGTPAVARERGQTKSKQLDRTAKSPVPSPQEQHRVEKQVRDIFQKDFADARSIEQKAALAAKLFSHGQSTADDPVGRFLLWREACRLYVESGESAKAIQVIDEISQHYDVNPFAMKVEAIHSIAKSIHGGAFSAAVAREFIDAAVGLADLALSEDQFAVANDVLGLAITMSRKLRDAPLVKDLTARSRESERLESRFVPVKAALEILGRNPTDPEASLTVGSWYCLIHGKWDKGLALLAQGSDRDLAAAARIDLASPKEPIEQMAVADRWWTLADRWDVASKNAILLRAGYWYDVAIPRLSGLDKAKAQARLEAIRQPGEIPGASTGRSTRAGIVQKGNVALATNGATVKGVARGAAYLLDGDLRHDDMNGYAESKWPCEWTIALKRVYLLKEIAFLLSPKQDRFYRYTVAVSSDGTNYIPLVDRNQGQWSGWQQMRFAPRPIRYIRIAGLYNSANECFHIIEFEAYCIPPASPRK